MSALLRVDRAVAEGYLRLQSLKWQYQAMVTKFAPFSERWSRSRIKEEMRRLYREHYFHPDDSEFEREISAHLLMRKVSRERWPSIVEGVRVRVRRYKPGDFARHNGAKGVPFYDILDEAIEKHEDAS